MTYLVTVKVNIIGTNVMSWPKRGDCKLCKLFSKMDLTLLATGCGPQMPTYMSQQTPSLVLVLGMEGPRQGQVRPSQVRSGQIRSDQVDSGQVRSGPGQDRPSQVRSVFLKGHVDELSIFGTIPEPCFDYIWSIFRH